jgi:hypothetical protein
MPNPFLLIIIGFVLVLAAALLAWLIFLRILPSTILLDFFTFGMSILGVLLGVAGSASYVKMTRDRRKKEIDQDSH